MLPEPAYRNRATVAVEFLVPEVEVVLDLQEVREKVGPRPAWVAETRPAVVVERGATNGDASVHHRGAPDESPARQPDAVAVGQRLVPVVPIHLGDARRKPRLTAADREQRCERLLVGKVRASLEQKHRALSGFGEPRRDDTAARSGSDYNDVEVLHTALL